MGIYHPPPGNDTTNAMFIDDITDLLADKIGKYNNIVMLGDLHMRVDDLSNAASHIVNDIMQTFGPQTTCYFTNPQIWPHPRPDIQQSELRAQPS